MISIVDWILDKMRLVDVAEEMEGFEPEQEAESAKKSWTESGRWKKDKVPEENGRVYFKVIATYADCKLLIDHYRLGTVCIYRLETEKNPDAQGMMNYICGGVYALDGEVSDIGKNVFMASPFCISFGKRDLGRLKS